MKKLIVIILISLLFTASAVPEFATETECGVYFTQQEAEGVLCFVYEADMPELLEYFSWNYAGFALETFTMFPNNDGFYFETPYYHYAIFQREPGHSLIVLLPY